MDTQEFVTIDKVKRADIKQLFESPDHSTESCIVNSLYCIINLNEDHEKLNFKQKINAGVISLSGYLKEFNLKKITGTGVYKAKRHLRGINETLIGPDSRAALALYNWLRETILNCNVEEVETIENVKEETKIPSEKLNDEIPNKIEEEQIRSPTNSCTWETLNFSWPSKEINESLNDYIERNMKNVGVCRKDIVEIASFNNPPAVVCSVMSAANIILGMEDESWSAFKKNKSMFLEILTNLDIMGLTPKVCRRALKHLEKVNIELITKVSKACCTLYSFVNFIINKRIAIGLYGNEEVDRKCFTTSSTRKKKSPKKSPKKVEQSPIYHSSIQFSDSPTSFAKAIDDTRSPFNETTGATETPFTHLSYYDLPGYDWRLFRSDSPIRRRILREANDDYKAEYDKIARNSLRSQAKVLEEMDKDLFNSSYSYKISDFPDLNYQRHKQDIMIDTAIQKERMNPKNINSTKSRVSYHWSPKRRKEMQKESEYMTGYYTDKLIKDIVNDKPRFQLTQLKYLN